MAIVSKRKNGRRGGAKCRHEANNIEDWKKGEGNVRINMQKKELTFIHKEGRDMAHSLYEKRNNHKGDQKEQK